MKALLKKNIPPVQRCYKRIFFPAIPLSGTIFFYLHYILSYTQIFKIIPASGYPRQEDREVGILVCLRATLDLLLFLSILQTPIPGTGTSFDTK